MEAVQRSPGYSVEREVLDEQSLEEVAQRREKSPRTPLADRLKHSLRCSGRRLRRSVLRWVPVLSWLPRYSFRDSALGDLVSGVSVGIMHLPQGMAYALLASVPPVFGLYSSFYPVLVYFIFGTSRHISIGSIAVISLMVGSVTERLAPNENFLHNDTNGTEVLDLTARDTYRVQVAAAVTSLAGMFQVVLGLVQFGFVVTYLSNPLVRGYTTGAVVNAVISQLKYIFGLHPQHHRGPLSLVYTLIDVCWLLPQTNLGTLVVSVVSLVALIAAKELNVRLSRKLPLPIPVELIMIIAGTLVSCLASLQPQYGVEVVGEISSGLQPPRAPDVSLFREVIGDAFALAIVGYAISISLGKTFALKHGYKVDSSQELVALGLSNTVGGFFQCYSVSSSMSRSLIQESTGGKTQMASAVSAVIVLVTVLKLGSLFQSLPKAVLSAIVFVNLKGMFMQFLDICTLWRSSKIDLLVWVVTFISTLLLNLDLGLAASIGFALLTVIFRTQLPRYSILGQILGTELYLDVKMYAEAREIPGITIFRSSATVYFANAELYLEALKKKSGIDIGKLLTYKRKQVAKQQRREQREQRRARRHAKRTERTLKGPGARETRGSVFSVEKEAQLWREQERHMVLHQGNGTVFVRPQAGNRQVSWEYLKMGDPDTATLGSVSELEGDTSTVDSSCDTQDTLSRDLERLSLGSLGKWSWDIHSIILDLSTCNFLDTVAINTLKSIFTDFGEIDVGVYIAGCQACVVEQLECGDFFIPSLTKRHLFPSVHDAVLHCLQLHGTPTAPGYDCVLDMDCSTKL
ncbi:solute carrier family 26 member 6 [Amia ocellicauda]|uniref:solute carrier family 26 member 6 n=1 Tax=Amia ocellicauda TaxID=2972642 RepID=UPI0034643EA3